MLKKYANFSNVFYGVPELKVVYNNRFKKQINKPQAFIKDVSDILNFITPLYLACEEYFIAIHLKCNLEIIGLHEISHGSLTEAIIHPREIFKMACLCNTHSLIFCHNHPSGSVEPSFSDIEHTKTIISAARILGFNVLDHIIIGANNFKRHFSFRDKKGFLWTD